MSETEQRELRVIRKPVELRAIKGDDGGDVFSGYVFAWDTPSDDLGGFVEVIRRGAATKALAQQKNIFAILDHDKEVQKVLGDRDSGTLKLTEDDRGLAFELHAHPTQAAKDAAVVAQRSTIGVSFAFICGKQNWTTGPNGSRLREIVEFRELDDFSLVVDAAYKSSDVTVAKRSLEEHLEVERRAAASGGTEKRDATPAPDRDRLQSLLALLRGQHWLYYSAHWQAAGPNAYGMHLLFEQLYSGLPKEFDTLAEKMVVYFDETAVAPGLIMALAQAWVAKWSPGQIPAVQALITSEGDLQAASKETYDALKAAEQLPPGLDDYLLALANEHDTNAYLLGQAIKPAATGETRNAKEPEEMENGPNVDFLRRQLDQFEIELRCGMVAENRDQPNHDVFARRAHHATERALDSKRGSGAPSRALELAAASAHDEAAESAKGEKRAAAEKFHRAASSMHTAASGDDYAADYMSQEANYRRQEANYRRAAAIAVERRDNPNHHADGKFHNGSPENLLAASQGRLMKAEARHGAACEAYRAAHGDKGADHADTAAALSAWQEARAAHQGAIEAADATMADVTTAHEARCSEHRSLVDASRAKWASPEYANPAGA